MFSGREDQTFFVGDLSVDSNNFQLLNLTLSDNGTDAYCLAGQFDPNSNELAVVPTSCYESHGIICRTLLITDPVCTATTTFVKQNTFDLLLDPKKQADKKRGVTQKKTAYKGMMLRLDQSNSFRALFSNLWYASLPCYDVKNVTANSNGERAVLKYCEWKGAPISCAAIFDAFPTDRGMCCAFNMKAAEDIFLEGPYPKIVKQLQESDRNASFIDSTIPSWYKNKNEPKTLPGRNKGLVLMLDAHTELFAPGSVDSDFDGFLGLISPSGTFPQMLLEGFEIKPGHNNIISLTASQIDADDSLKDLAVTDRKCKFSTENSDMKIHKNYTYQNCIFECSLLYALNQMSNTTVAGNDYMACVPWFFPSPVNTNIPVCDPWQSVNFFGFMALVPDDECTRCLPGDINT